MRKNKNIFKWVTFLVIGLATIIGCGELDDTHEEFIENGEQIYVGKPMLVFSNAGNERIKLNMLISADPKITKGQVTWNSGESTHDFAVARTRDGLDTLSMMLDIPEGSYAFEITLMDDHGHSSLTYEHQAVVYGPKYIASLFNRAISETEALPDRVILTWGPAESGVTETVLSYVNRNGENREVAVAPEDTETVLDDYAIGGECTVVTNYKPNAFALETFSTASESFSFPAVVSLDRSLWQKVVLPTDAIMDCYGGSIEKLWDGNTGSWYHSGCEGNGIPHHFTIDLGVSAGVSKFSIKPRQECCQERNPKHFQLWGIQDIENAETTAAADDPNWADDAEAKGWVLLLDGKPDESWNGSKADYEVEIPENISVRYVRFRFLETFNGGQETALSEFKFWATSVN